MDGLLLPLVEFFLDRLQVLVKLGDFRLGFGNGLLVELGFLGNGVFLVVDFGFGDSTHLCLRFAGAGSRLAESGQERFAFGCWLGEDDCGFLGQFPPPGRGQDFGVDQFCILLDGGDEQFSVRTCRQVSAFAGELLEGSAVIGQFLGFFRVMMVALR